ncbi:hypothetical protein HPP92_025563 [Vanilla planifolia]|uniref:CTLH domain-containing protein n=1 Tax=Vanilla planifolia TaxID=51239 RepID=A0A835PGU9_VANPL|nr:hypothetical protein HPP92_025563 [Vanilla planifolia]
MPSKSIPTSTPDPCKTLGCRLPINHSEFVRLILSSLYSLGYRRAALSLELESGIPLDSMEYSSLLTQILSGRWDDCICTIDSIDDLDARKRTAAAFLVFREHFLELVSSGNMLLLAIDVLQKRISPLELDRSSVHRLARAIVSLEEKVTLEDRFRRRIGLLMDLVEVLPPWIKVPCGRLEHLVETAVLKQVESCLYHNSPEEVTLFEDHKCSLEHIPYIVQP